MERIGIPAERLHSYELVSQEGSVGEREAIAAARLSAADDLARAGGAIMVVLRSMPPIAAARSGRDGVSAEADLDIEAWSVEILDGMGDPLAAAMVRDAIAFKRAALTRQAAPRRRGARP